MSNILIKPIITEKSTKLGEKLHRYAFRVDRDANRLQIKKAVETAYGVKVEDVNTAVIPGKLKVRQTKQGIARGMKPAYKKAYVTLKEGQEIDFYGTV
ncbi:MAG: 50S ribosomal protein L23 [Bacteroidetes bacterium]|nr:50S ribosomal protein L23 [Bacteroidota bacterium]MBS1684835.1 50S ribosomal protein L23 [Bacteroidota bacterium]